MTDTTKTAEELLELTPAQAKAWSKIADGMKEFKKAGGAFYAVLDNLSGYNPKYVKDIQANEHGDIQGDNAGMPTVCYRGLCSYADDDPGIYFTDAGLKLIGRLHD